MLFSYAGNKDREVPEILKMMPNINKISTIIEPFGGSFALIRKLVTMYPNKKYIVNDIDKQLIECFKTMTNKEENEKVIEEIKNKMIDIDKEKYKKIIQDNSLSSYLIKMCYYSIRPGIFPTTKKVNINYDRIKNFQIFNVVDFYCADGLELIEKYKDDPNIFIFVDPPYFLSCNDFYLSGITEKIIDLLINIKKYKCKILYVVNNHYFIKLMIKYEKLKIKGITKIKYNISHKETEHVYISNY